MKIILAFILLVATANAADTWKPAAPGYTFTFPSDHAAHPEHRIEWWYWTGNLTAADGHQFGYQLTFFRSGVARQPSTPSKFAIRDLYLAHFAVSDITGTTFHHAHQLHRAGIARAGDAFDPGTGTTRVWNDRWNATISDTGQRLIAHDPVSDIAIELDLTSLKPPALNGIDGYSQKGSDPDNASLYYSLTRLQTTGTVTVADVTHTVTGLSWMDREFGSSFLEPGQQGWDWFSLHLDDGRDLMLYQLRREDGTTDPFSAGTLVETDGTTTHLTSKDFSLTPDRTWKSDTTDATYPVAWTIALPAQNLTLTTTTTFPDQEFTTESISYWEGAVRVGGSTPGRGYLEMTGYSGTALSRALSQ